MMAVPSWITIFKRIIALSVQLKYYHCILVHLLYVPIRKTLSYN